MLLPSNQFPFSTKQKLQTQTRHSLNLIKSFDIARPPHIDEIARIRLCDLQACIHSKSYDLGKFNTSCLVVQSHKTTSAP